MTATELRKNLFQILDQVSNGITYEIEYKGQSIKLVSAQKRDWTSLLVERDVGGDHLENESGWSKEAQAEWNAEWDEFLSETPKPAKSRKRISR